MGFSWSCSTRLQHKAKGVEMEADFEGDTHDLPSDAEDEGEGDEEPDQERRLDQEMGDVGDAGQVTGLRHRSTVVLCMLRQHCAAFVMPCMHLLGLHSISLGSIFSNCCISINSFTHQEALLWRTGERVHRDVLVEH